MIEFEQYKFQIEELKELSKEEMIIMITPHIVYGEDDMKRIEQKSNSNIQL